MERTKGRGTKRNAWRCAGIAAGARGLPAVRADGRRWASRRPAVRVVQALTDRIHDPVTVKFESTERERTMHKHRNALSAYLIVSILSVAGGRADVRVDLLGQWGGSTRAAPVILRQFFGNTHQIEHIATQGRLVLVPFDPGLQVIDATEPRQPRLVGEYDSNGRPHGIAVSNGLTFLANWEGGIEIVAVRPEGDLDGDGAVGIFDLTSLLSNFGACTADAAYNRYADLDGDECVTVQDLASILAAMGR